VIWLHALGAARIAGVVLTMLLFFLLCGATWWRERRRLQAEQRRVASLLPAGDAAAPWLVAYASQTGTAEQLAWQTARSLQLAGVPAQVTALSSVGRELLQRVERALFIVSTYGEGDPPDGAAPFVRNTMLAQAGAGGFGNLHFGVLALGDSTYAEYCGFGRKLHQWLADQGARPLFERIDADKLADSAIEQWRHELAHIAGTRDAPDWSGPVFDAWQLVTRQRLNPGSDGEAACHLELRPSQGELPEWEAGDLLQVRVPGEEHPREYSIASIPADGSVHLLVRQARRADGTLGSASGWLLARAAVGDALPARIREHRGFRLGGNADRAMILIGNGTGLAGLRALIKARAANPGRDPRNWLIFGERSAQHDAFYAADVQQWREQGTLTRCDLVYSRDQLERRYVQHRLAECRDEVRAWVDAGAAIYVCGSLKGMAAEVDAELEATLGRAQLDALSVDGRYRRDVY
jgi:sulfite reductase (NADPH) flavoprotein alpha-component